MPFEALRNRVIEAQDNEIPLPDLDVALREAPDVATIVEVLEEAYNTGFLD